MKDIMKLSPSTSQFLVSAAFFPWSIKPIYGIVSDCIPIKQSKRVPYLIISSGLSLFPWLIIGCKTISFGNQHNPLGVAYLIIYNGCQNLLVISSHYLGHEWLFGSLLGGYALSNLPINAIYIMFSALPLFQLVTCVFLKESPKGFESTTDNAAHDHADGQNIHSAFAGQGSGESFKYEGTRKRKGARKKSKRRSLSKRSEAHEKHNKSVDLYSSLKSALVSLCTAFKQPAILRPMAWFFISNAAVPNISTVTFYYQTEVLHLEASFLGTARVIGWFAHVGLVIITVLDILLVSRLHIQYGIADKYMVLLVSALADAINQFKMMPFLILSGQLCPPGIEGTLFALFMSINNLSSTLGSFLGAALMSALNISSVQFDNLALGLAVRLMGTLLPIGFLFLIAWDVTGLTS
ncbi:hypothetical protein VPH35_051284 [Triticum aestivum]